MYPAPVAVAAIEQGILTLIQNTTIYGKEILQRYPAILKKALLLNQGLGSLPHMPSLPIPILVRLYCLRIRKGMTFTSIRSLIASLLRNKRGAAHTHSLVD